MTGIAVIIFLVFALVLFVIAAFVHPTEGPRGKLALLGLACWVAAELLSRVVK